MPQLVYESTAQRVLAIPELLHIIFGFGTRASNASNALVCRNWREAALDHVWMEVDDIFYLLQLLAPLHHRQGEIKFYVSQHAQPWATAVKYFLDIPTHTDPRRLGALYSLCSPPAHPQIWCKPTIKQSYLPRR